MCRHGKTVVLKAPEFIKKYRPNNDEMHIDSCLKIIIEKLWENKIETLGCCCGHGKSVMNIIIGDGYKGKEIKKIETIVRKNSIRDFELLQWKLCVASSYKRWCP